MEGIKKVSHTEHKVETGLIIKRYVKKMISDDLIFGEHNQENIKSVKDTVCWVLRIFKMR